MVEETIKRIRAVEERAKEIIETAEKDKLLANSQALKKAAAFLNEAEKSTRLEARAILEKAKKEALTEKEAIEKKNQEEINLLRAAAVPKIEEAKKLCR